VHLAGFTICVLSLSASRIWKLWRTLDADRKEYGNAVTGLHGSNDAVHLWDGPKFIGGVADEQSIYKRDAGRQHHGSHPDDEYHALRDVYVSLQPDRRGGYGGGPRSTHAYALYSEYTRAMGYWRAYGVAGKHANSG